MENRVRSAGEGRNYELTEVPTGEGLSTADIRSPARYEHVQISAATSFIAQT
jgi:hypothetical protein